MNHEERNERSGTYQYFRTSLDIGMGVLYIVIGGMILFVKYFGTMELSTGFAYVLGGLMVAYGIFRIYRGFQAMRNNRRSATRNRPRV